MELADAQDVHHVYLDHFVDQLGGYDKLVRRYLLQNFRKIDLKYPFQVIYRVLKVLRIPIVMRIVLEFIEKIWIIRMRYPMKFCMEVSRNIADIFSISPNLL